MEQIVLLGGGGHCKSVLDSIISGGKYEIFGIVDSNKSKDDNMFGVSFLGGDEILPELISKGIDKLFITVGSVGDTTIRRKLYEKCKSIGFSFPTIIDRSACVSEFACVEEGVFIGKNAIINATSTIRKMAIINSGAIIEHDCEIGEFVHISPAVTLCGNVKIGDDSHIGANATVIQGISIPPKTVVGAGGVVVKNITAAGVYVGNPVAFLR